MKKLFLVDAYALIFRSYYAFISRPMRNREGMNTSAIFGFVKFLTDMIRREQPHYIGVAFDPKGGNFRNQIYDQYKANRSATPEDIINSTPYIKEILKAMRIPILEVAGYEADDVIGTLSAKAACKDFEVFMVTPDKDFGQLIQPCVYMYKQRKGGEGIEIIGMDKIKENYGIDDPKLVIDILALWGDASDNIPGVPGIGEKSAVKLVNEWGTVEQIIENADKIKGKNGENIANLSEQIMLAKRLATIDLNVPIEFEPDKLIIEEPDYEALRKVYDDLNFTMFIREMERSGNVVPNENSESQQPAKPQKPTIAAAPDLFSSMGETFSGDTNAQGDLFQSVNVESIYATAETTPHNYHLVTEESDLKTLAAKLAASENICFDTETTGFDVFNDRLVGVSFAVEEFEAYYIPCPTDRDATTKILSYFKPIFESEKISKTAQNAKFDIMFLKSYDIEIKGTIYDTMIIHYLLDPESRHGMDFLAKRYLEYSPISIESLIGKGARQLTMDMIPIERVAEYAAEDADVTLRLFNVLYPKLVEANLETLYLTIEEPLIRVLAAMEREGVRIDYRSLNVYGEELRTELLAIESEIRDIAKNPDLNVNSAKQLGEVLFDRMKIDPKAKRTKTKQYRTDEEYLQSISDRHPVIQMILEYRGLKKLLSTYIEALPLLINTKTSKIHTSYNQAVTATGRLSSNNPNLQNIPIRDERGRKLRGAFIPSEDGCLIMSTDYSQVELRLMAHLSGDKNMIEDFLKEKDIHSATAARLFGVSEQEVTRDQRRMAKTANFGIIYGISAFGLAQRLTIPRTEAKQIIDGYFATYPGVKSYMDNVIEQATEQGFVETLFGRKRILPDIKSGNAIVRGLAQRNAINAPIQGGAADIMKIAMIRLFERLNNEKLKSKMMLQVHDEVVLNVYPDELEQVKRIVIESMEGAAQLRVPLTADCGVGENWLDAH